MACSFYIDLYGAIFVASYRLHLQRQAIETVVAAANLVDRDPISVALIERGEVTTPTEKFASTRLRAMGKSCLTDRENTGCIRYL